MARTAVRRWWLLGVVLCLVAGIVVTIVTGGREPAAAVRLLPGTAWLEDQATGAVSEIFGYSGTAETPVRVGRAGDPFRIIQTPDGALVLDERTGVLSRVGGSGSGVSLSSQTSGSGSSLRVLTAGSVSWELDPESGIVSQLSAATLKPTGKQVALGSSTGSAVLDASGDLWVAVPARGAVVEVSLGGQVQSHDVGRVGDTVQVAATTNGIWGVDGSLGEILPVAETSGAAVPLSSGPVPSGAAQPIVASTPSSPDVVALSGPSATDLDTGSGQVSSLSTPEMQGADQAVLADGRAYLLDPARHLVDELSLDPLAQLTQANVPAGSDQLIGKDQLVFVNASGSPQAAVINRSGKVTPITKYQAPTTNRTNDASSGVDTSPGPGPGFQPTGGAEAGAPGGGRGGRGLGVAGTGANGQMPTTTSAPPVTDAPATTASSPTTAVAPPGQPTITSIGPASGQAHSLSLSWKAGSGPVPSGFAVTVTPEGGSGTTRRETAGTMSDSFGNLTPGKEYCAQVQSLSSAGGASPVSGPQCAIVALVKPTTAPVITNVAPDNRVVDVTFAAAPGVDPGTVYEIDGTTQLASPDDCAETTDDCKPELTQIKAAGTYALSVALPTGPDAVPGPTDGVSSVTVAVTVKAMNTAGSGPASASQSSWAYATIGIQSCRDQQGYAFEYSAQNCNGPANSPIRMAPYSIIPTKDDHESVPMAGSEAEVVCGFSNTAGVWIYQHGAPGEFACPADPAGFPLAGMEFETVWATSAGDHTVKVTEVEIRIQGQADPEYVLCGPREVAAPWTVAGATSGTTLNANVTSWYADLPGS